MIPLVYMALIATAIVSCGNNIQRVPPKTEFYYSDDPCKREQASVRKERIYYDMDTRENIFPPYHVPTYPAQFGPYYGGAPAEDFGVGEFDSFDEEAVLEDTFSDRD